MSNLQTSAPMAKNLEKVLLGGDLSVLQPADKISYYKSVCDSVGLNPLTKPFEYMKLNGKEVLYATRACTEQLRFIHKISVEIKSREKIDTLYVVTATARNPEGRVDESTGAVDLTGLKGDSLANAFLKAETKAKRRVTLSICGLSLLDETEVASIPNVERVMQTVTSEPTTEQVDAFDNMLKAPSIATYEITFGKFKGKRFDDVDGYDLQSYCDYILRKAQEDKKPIKGQVQEFLDLANEYLTGLDTGVLML